MKISIKEQQALQAKMYDELEKKIESLKDKNRINGIEYTIARDVLWDCTENNHLLTFENNIAEDFINDLDNFINKLKQAYLEMKKDFPDIDCWNLTSVNEYSHDYLDYVYQ